ncbi:MAG TPA: GAF domain-containing protein, partial [Candidatus Rifleibacterium sp.]|nr:GAF domain-containing protein [Candidatus Rifleibacterium sp.]
MAENTQEAKTLKDRLPDILGLLGSVVVIVVAVMIFTNKFPRNLQNYFSYFYLIAVAGVIGLLGEKLAVTLLSFALPLLLGAATLAIKFKPEKYPLEDWWEIYSIIVLGAAGFLVYLFFRFEQIKAMGGNAAPGQIGADPGGPLKTRVDPAMAAKYRDDKLKKGKDKDNQMDDALKSEKDGEVPATTPAAGESGAPAAEKKEDPDAPPEKIESSEERMEREMREIRDEFSKRSMKLTTTLMRIKNLTKSLDRDQIFTNIVEIISKGLDSQKVQLLLNDEKEGKFRVVKALGLKPKEYKEIEIPHEENSMITYLLRQKMNEVTGGAGALGVKECEMDPKTKGLIGQGVLKTLIAAPIYAEGKLFAIINVEHMTNPDYTRDDQNLIATCADVAGLVMKNAKLYSATMDDLVSAQKLSED